jgi:hypothetical protein
MARAWERREWLLKAGVSAGVVSSGRMLQGALEEPHAEAQDVDPGVAFFFVSDTH